MEGLDIPTLLSLVGILKETYTFSLEKDLSKHPLSLSGSLHGLWASAHRQETHAVSPKSWGCKIALEVYKLSLEIEGRDVQTWSWAPVKNQYISFPSLPFKNRELGTFFSLATLPFLQCYYLLKKCLYLKDLWYFLMPLIVWNYWWLIFSVILSFCVPDFGQRTDQIRSVTQSCPTLCDPMNRSTPGLPVHHQLPEFTQTHVHRVSDAIQPSHPLSSPSPLAPNPSQHKSLFQWVSSSHEVAKVLEFQL